MSHCTKCTHDITFHDKVQLYHLEPEAPRPPTKGDISICEHCALIGEFDAALNLIPVTEQMWRTITEEERVFLRSIQQRIRNTKGLDAQHDIKLTCPTCGWTSEGATECRWNPQLGPRKPRPGDLGVCGGCGTLTKIDDPPTTMHVMTDEEFQVLPHEAKQQLLSLQHFFVKSHRDNRHTTN